MKSEISKIAQAPGVVAIFKSTTKDTEFYQPDTTLPPWRAVLETTTQVRT